jgi:hypothetical protein
MVPKLASHVKNKGSVPLYTFKAVYLRCRVRYFTDGAVIGNRSFVNEIFTTLKDRFGAKRETGARLIRGLEKEGKLYAMRDLKQGAIGLSSVESSSVMASILHFSMLACSGSD